MVLIILFLLHLLLDVRVMCFPFKKDPNPHHKDVTRFLSRPVKSGLSESRHRYFYRPSKMHSRNSFSKARPFKHIRKIKKSVALDYCEGKIAKETSNGLNGNEWTKLDGDEVYQVFVEILEAGLADHVSRSTADIKHKETPAVSEESVPDVGVRVKVIPGHVEVRDMEAEGATEIKRSNWLSRKGGVRKHLKKQRESSSIDPESLASKYERKIYNSLVDFFAFLIKAHVEHEKEKGTLKAHLTEIVKKFESNGQESVRHVDKSKILRAVNSKKELGRLKYHAPGNLKRKKVRCVAKLKNGKFQQLPRKRCNKDTDETEEILEEDEDFESTEEPKSNEQLIEEKTESDENENLAANHIAQMELKLERLENEKSHEGSEEMDEEIAKEEDKETEEETIQDIKEEIEGEAADKVAEEEIEEAANAGEQKNEAQDEELIGEIMKASNEGKEQETVGEIMDEAQAESSMENEESVLKEIMKDVKGNDESSDVEKVEIPLPAETVKDEYQDNMKDEQPASEIQMNEESAPVDGQSKEETHIPLEPLKEESDIVVEPPKIEAPVPLVIVDEEPDKSKSKSNGETKVAKTVNTIETLLAKKADINKLILIATPRLLIHLAELSSMNCVRVLQKKISSETSTHPTPSPPQENAPEVEIEHPAEPLSDHTEKQDETSGECTGSCSSEAHEHETVIKIETDKTPEKPGECSGSCSSESHEQETVVSEQPEKPAGCPGGCESHDESKVPEQSFEDHAPTQEEENGPTQEEERPAQPEDQSSETSAEQEEDAVEPSEENGDEESSEETSDENPSPNTEGKSSDVINEKQMEDILYTIIKKTIIHMLMSTKTTLGSGDRTEIDEQVADLPKKAVIRNLDNSIIIEIPKTDVISTLETTGKAEVKDKEKTKEILIKDSNPKSTSHVKTTSPKETRALSEMITKVLRSLVDNKVAHRPISRPIMPVAKPVEIEPSIHCDALNMSDKSCILYRKAGQPVTLGVKVRGAMNPQVMWKEGVKSHNGKVMHVDILPGSSRNLDVKDNGLKLRVRSLPDSSIDHVYTAYVSLPSKNLRYKRAPQVEFRLKRNEQEIVKRSRGSQPGRNGDHVPYPELNPNLYIRK